jgi:hypothetical protein
MEDISFLGLLRKILAEYFDAFGRLRRGRDGQFHLYRNKLPGFFHHQIDLRACCTAPEVNLRFFPLSLAACGPGLPKFPNHGFQRDDKFPGLPAFANLFINAYLKKAFCDKVEEIFSQAFFRGDCSQSG